MIFKKKKIIGTPGLKLGMTVCVVKFDVRKNQDTAEVGYIVARKQVVFEPANPYCSGGVYWKYLIKFSDGTTVGYKEDEIYLDYDKRFFKTGSEEGWQDGTRAK